MTKKQWKNLWRRFRYMRRLDTVQQTLAWIGHFDQRNASVIRKVIS